MKIQGNGRPQIKPLPSQTMSIAEAALHFKVADSTVYRWIEAGWIPSGIRGVNRYIKSSIVSKVNAARDIDPSGWHQHIDWAPEDMPAKGDTTPKVVYGLSPKGQHFVKLAKKLLAEGETEAACVLAIHGCDLSSAV